MCDNYKRPSSEEFLEAARAIASNCWKRQAEEYERIVKNGAEECCTNMKEAIQNLADYAGSETAEILRELLVGMVWEIADEIANYKIESAKKEEAKKKCQRCGKELTDDELFYICMAGNDRRIAAEFDACEECRDKAVKNLESFMKKGENTQEKMK